MPICCAIFTACAPKTVTKIEYRDVFVPVKCNAPIPQRPEYNADPVMGVVDLLEYVEKLELVIKACTGIETNKKGVVKWQQK